MNMKHFDTKPLNILYIIVLIHVWIGYFAFRFHNHDIESAFGLSALASILYFGYIMWMDYDDLCFSHRSFGKHVDIIGRYSPFEFKSNNSYSNKITFYDGESESYYTSFGDHIEDYILSHKTEFEAWVREKHK